MNVDAVGEVCRLFLPRGDLLEFFWLDDVPVQTGLFQAATVGPASTAAAQSPQAVQFALT